MSSDAVVLSALLAAALDGDRQALARLISAAERGATLPPLTPPTDRAEHQLCIGFTGAPGAGKSTLVSALTGHLIAEAGAAAVLAVDPSSPFSRGALLGDRVRMHEHAMDPRVFIRSMATRSETGGLARATQVARRILQACGWGLVLLETVGVGQVELDVVYTADLVVVVLNPGWGDEIQANKAGLMEIADIFVINKADREGLESTRRDIDAVIINRPEHQRPAVVETVASEGKGVKELAKAISLARESLCASGELHRRRQRQFATELEQELLRRFKVSMTQLRQEESYGELVEALASGADTLDGAASRLQKIVLGKIALR